MPTCDIIVDMRFINIDMRLMYDNLRVNYIYSQDIYVNMQDNFIYMQYVNVKMYENYVNMILHVGDRYMPPYKTNFHTSI